MGKVSALYFMTSVRALLLVSYLRSAVSMCPHYKVFHLPAFCSGQLSALYCAERFCALLWGKCRRSTVGQVPALSFRASVCSILWAKNKCSTVVQESDNYCEANILALLCASVRALLRGKELSFTVIHVSAFYCGLIFCSLLWGEFTHSTVSNCLRLFWGQ
jgi:hypothetical protein